MARLSQVRLPGPALAVGLALLSFGVRQAWAFDAGALEAGGANVSPGWRGFSDWSMLGDLALSLLLAAGLASVIGYHPMRQVRARRIDEVEAPRVNVVYATVGAIIGTLVANYGTLVGFVVFGIGGLMRFRSNIGTAGDTGRVMLSTLVGLCCGLQLPHVAVVATVFSFFLLAILDRRAVVRLVVKGLGHDNLANAAAVYRTQLEQQRCELVSEEKSFPKGQVAFVFFLGSGVDPDSLSNRLEQHVPAELRGAVDWEIG